MTIQQAVHEKVNETMAAGFPAAPTYLYLGRFEDGLLDKLIHDTPNKQANDCIGMKRREFMGMLVFVVDAARHLEVGFGPK